MKRRPSEEDEFFYQLFDHTHSPMKKRSWKTTSTGLTLIGGALITAWFKRHEITEALAITLFAAIVSGIGQLCARDDDKSSEDVGAK